MPTYVFQCPKCHNTLEMLMTLREFTEQPFPLCMEEGCDGQQRMKTTPQPVGSIFKGSGWTPKYSHGASDGAPTDIMMPKKR